MIDDEDLDEGTQDGGETVELEDDDLPGVEDTEDGGALVSLDEDGDLEDDAEFYANLAEKLPESQMNRLAAQLLELISRDKEARAKRDEQYEEGIRRTGLGDDAPGGASFAGASKVVHPLLTEVCVDFAARAIKELFPPSGPVKDDIVGEPTEDKIKLAKRKTALMNWQLTTQAPEFRSELEQLLTQVPLGGAQYLKIVWDEDKNRPRFEFIAIDDMLIPFAATNFYTAQRKTHVQYITALQYSQRVKSGMYRDVDLPSPGMDPERSLTDVANDKIEGRSPTAYNEDGLRKVFECYCTVEVEGDDKADGPASYIISLDSTSQRILSIYRNWDEEDAAQEELIWVVEFPFVPWRGAYPIGIIHMIGGLSAAATGALRALLDSAHINNSPTMLKLKGGAISGQSMTLKPGEVGEIEGGLNVDDIRKLAMPFPFNPPNATLFQLLGFVVDAGKGVVRTALEDAASTNPNAPVGTTLARIEQGMVVFSAIHQRLHAAMGRVLDVLHRLNATYLDDKNIKAEVGEELATRKDFRGPKSVVPVSDPNIFSEAQRFAQVQAVAQRAATLPQLYNQRKVEERILETLKIPAAKDLLNPPVEPREQNAVNENVAAAMGRPVIAFPEQDHAAHLQTHISFMLSPMFGASQLIGPQLLPIMINHIKEHVALWYAQQVFDMTSEMAGKDISEEMRQNKDPEDKRAFDRMLAEANLTALQLGQDALAQVPVVVQQAIALLQKLAPPQQAPQDPTAAVAMAEVQRKTADDQAKRQIEQQELALKQQDAQQDAQLDQAQLQLEQENQQLKRQIADMQQAHEDQRKASEIAARVQMNTQDNDTARDLAELEVMSGEKIALSTGTGINPGPGA